MPDPFRIRPMPLYQSEGKDGGGASFTDPVFDDEYYGRDQAGGRGRTIGLVVGVIFGAVVAGTAAWFVFGPGGAENRGTTPLIVAEPEPYKVRPVDPGGLQVENQDKLVYERLGDGAPEPGVENILPPPEAPTAPQAPPQAAPQTAPAETAPAEPESQTAALEEAVPDDTAPVSPPSESPPSVASSQPEQQDTPVEPPPTVVEEQPPVQAAEPAAAPVEEAPAQEEPAQSLESMVAALSGDYLIQIAALRSEEAALGEWNRISSRFPEALGQFKPLVVRADLGERGIFYRLRAGPLQDRAAADSLCETLSAQNVGCLVVRNE